MKWLKILGANVRAFFKHPVQYSKGYIEDFKKCDAKGRIKKALLTIVGVYVCYQAIIFVLAFILVAGMVGGSDYYVLTGRFVDRFGREPENDYELYHNYQDIY